MLFLFVVGRVDFADFASHTKIGNFTNAHFVNQHVLQFDISVNIAHCIMEVLEASHDLPEHRPNVVVGEGRSTVALENVKEGASRTELGEEVIGVGSVIGFEKRENMFVMK